MKTFENAKRPLPKIDVREGVLNVFNNCDLPAESFGLNDPEVADAAFKAVFFDDPTVQAALSHIS